jgi:hypothetical protein
VTDPDLIWAAVTTDADWITTVNPALGDPRLYPVVLPENSKFPAATYYLVSQPTDFTQAADQYRWPRYRIKLWSLVYHDLVPMAQIIAAIFGDPARTPFTRSWIEYPTHAEDHDADNHAFWRAIDVVAFSTAGSASQ